MPLGEGIRIAEYEIVSLLGAGGMGEVYRARDPRLRRDVAIKILPAFASSDSDRLRRFEQEATAAAALNHPNILAVYQMGTYEGSPYLVSELLEGETLREQIRRGGLAVRKAIDYGVQMARGLGAAHEKGIVHRDLKPENLFVTKDGRIKILDFGLAKLIQPAADSENASPTIESATELGQVMGTLGYMSPEQVRGEVVDHRTDIFAFGAVMYEMLTGARAFQKSTGAETMTAILREEPAAISQSTANVPFALQRVVQRCLEKSPEQRFHSASDLAFALEAVTDSGAASVPGRGLRKKSVVPLFLGLSVLLLAAGLFWHYRAVPSDHWIGPQIRSIAVLPFANAGKDPEMDYLGEGISEEVTNALSRVPDLQVMARSTVSHYKARQDDPQGVGHELHVDAVLAGRVVEHGGEVKVESELVNVQTGAQIWGERYSRKADDASALPGDITRDVASLLRPQMEGTQRETLVKVGTQNNEAYRLYLKGRYHFDRFTEADFKTASGFFEKAVALDGRYAAAHAGLADVLALQGYFGYGPSDEAYRKSRDEALRALQLDSELPESHISLALSNMMFFHDLPAAQSSLQKALTLDPKSAYAHEISCWLAVEIGRAAEAIAECRRAVELDPLSVLPNYSLADVYHLARQYDLSLKQANRVLEIDPRSPDGIDIIGIVYEAQGAYKAAAEQWVKLAELAGDEQQAKKLKEIFQKEGYPGSLREALKEAEKANDIYDAASDYALLGNKDAAFAALTRAVDSGQRVDEIALDPTLDSLRQDPRFPALLHRIGLTDEQIRALPVTSR